MTCHIFMYLHDSDELMGSRVRPNLVSLMAGYLDDLFC